MNDATDLVTDITESRILVIDDNEAIHQDFLKIFGVNRSRSTPSAAEVALLGGGTGFTGAPAFQIDSAYQGEEGLALVRLAQEQHSPYAMAFVDVRMPPGWDGIETTARIWQHDPDIQIVICTAYSDYSWSAMVAKLGRSDRLVILKKPFDTIEVVQLASALSEKWRLARQSRSMLEGLEGAVAERTRELVQSVDDLRRSESLKAAILESSLDCVITMDHEGKIVEFNPAAESTFGLARERVLGKDMAELIVPPRLRDAHRRGLAHYLATGQGPILGKRLELEAIRADGTEFPIELAITAIAGASKPMFTGYVRDITERKRSIEALRTSEREQRQLSEQLAAERARLVAAQRVAKVGSWELDMATMSGIWSDETHRIFETDRATFHPTRQDFVEMVHPEDRAGVNEAFGRALDQRVAGAVEYRLLLPDGRIKFVEEHWQVSYDEHERPVRAFGTCQDITERRQAERSLQERAQIAALGAEVGASLTRGTTLQETLKLCCEAIVEHLHAAFARIWTLNERDNMLELRASAGMYVHLDGPHGRVPVGKFKIGLIAQERKPHLTNQVLGDSRVGDQEWAKREGMVAFAGYPLLVEDHLLGVVAMFARNPLADVTLQGLASISNNIALGIERIQAESRLRESESRYRGLIEQASDGIFISDAEGNYLHANARWCELLGYDKGEMAGMNAKQTYVEEEKEIHAKRLEQVRAGQTLRFERKVQRKDGSTFPAEISLKMLDSGIFQGIFHDITDRKEQERRIARLSRIHAMLSGINSANVRIRDRQALLSEACRIAATHGAFRMAWFGYRNQATGEMDVVASAGFDDGFFERAHAAPKGAFGPGGVGTRALRERRTFIDNDIMANPDINPIRRAAVDGGCRSVIGLPLSEEGVTVGSFILYAEEKDFFDEQEVKLLEGLADDISFALTFIAQQQKVEFFAYYDALTGLANRRLFLERVAQYMRIAASGGHKLALFLFDLERFKNINDSLGRPAGDVLLKQVAEWLTLNLGDASLFARVDADHFGIVLPEVTRDGDVVRLVENTMKSFLEHPFRLNDAVFRIAAKVGGALFPDDGTDAETLFGNAEAALKRAKASGDRYLFYTQTMTEKVAGKLTLENQLRHAFQQGEFVLHYQPLVNLASGKLTGAEALIRWNDPRTGLVPPGRFIPVLEEIGLIYEVGRWALRQAIEDYLRWRAGGLAAVRISVNVSPLQLRNRGFIAEIEQAIGIDAQAAGGLELEITESLIMEDIKHSIASLQAIRALGVTIAIDDFGTGFSSLAYLARLPADVLKIDRSFVVEMTAGPQGLALVSTIIKLGHSLKLRVVAEGVETEEQSRLLRLLDCDEMQGFLFSKPVPAGIFESRFLAAKPQGESPVMIAAHT